MLKEILESTKTIKVYHGSNVKFNKIEPKYMMTDESNSQEGVGIYFARDKKVAQDYGKYVYEADINIDNFWDSREYVDEYISEKQFIKLMNELFKLNEEEIFYLVTDYGAEIGNTDEVDDFAFKTAWKIMKDEEVRNFTITLAEAVGVENFVKVWNKIFPKNDGFKNDELEFYVIINPKIKLFKKF